MRQSMIGEEDVDAQLWLHAAEAAIRRYCGWHIAPSLTTTLTLDGDGTRLLRLPTLHLTELTELTLDGHDALAEATWSQRGMVELTGRRHFPDQLGSIRITMTHGWDPTEVPDVIALILTIARRGASQPAVASQAVNGASVSYFSIGGAPLSIPLLRTEKEALAPYTIRRAIV